METPIFILAGGFGSRLAKVVNTVPKPLADIHGRPFLDYIIESYKNQGIRHFIFLIYHKADQMKAYISEKISSTYMQDCTIQYIEENEPLGTGGAIANGVREMGITGKFFVTNADTWLDSGIDDLSSCSNSAIAVVSTTNTSRFGTVKIIDGKVQSFLEKTGEQKLGYINAGLYLLDSSLFEAWDGKAFSIETTLFPDLVSKQKLEAKIIDSEFIDIGIPDDYYRFQDWITSGKEWKL